MLGKADLVSGLNCKATQRNDVRSLRPNTRFCATESNNIDAFDKPQSPYRLGPGAWIKTRYLRILQNCQVIRQVICDSLRKALKRRFR